MHIDESVLIQFALGILEKKEAGKVESELFRSAELRFQLRELQETLSTVAIAEIPVQPDDRLKEQILASLKPTRRFEGFSRRLGKLFDLGEKEIKRLIGKIDHPDSDEWTSSPVLPGVGIMIFPGGVRVASASCGLISVKPDTIFPRHRHQGKEWVLVLQGRARESDGRILRPGDLVLSEPGSEHAFRTLGPETYIFAVLLECENKWLIGHSLLDRLFGKRRFPNDIDD